MGPTGYVLLIVVAACIIALICISKKRKALDEESYIKTPTTSIPSTERTDTSNVPKETEKLLETAQNTIYEFRAKSTTRLCPFCDGENSLSAATCIICGRNLS